MRQKSRTTGPAAPPGGSRVRLVRVLRLLLLYRPCWPDAPLEYAQAIEQAITLGEAAVRTANAEGATYTEIPVDPAWGRLSVTTRLLRPHIEKGAAVGGGP